MSEALKSFQTPKFKSVRGGDWEAGIIRGQSRDCPKGHGEEGSLLLSSTMSEDTATRCHLGSLMQPLPNSLAWAFLDLRDMRSICVVLFVELGVESSGRALA